MFYDYEQAKAVSNAIDWDEVFLEYKRLGIPVSRFYKEYFAEICSRYTDTGYVVSVATVYNRLQKACRKARLKEAAQQQDEDVPASEVQPETIQPSPQQSGDSNIVAVYELGGDLLKSFSQEASDGNDACLRNDIAEPDFSSRYSAELRQYPPIPPQCLITEFKGMRFSFACRNPAAELASLLTKLSNNGLEA